MHLITFHFSCFKSLLLLFYFCIVFLSFLLFFSTIVFSGRIPLVKLSLYYVFRLLTSFNTSCMMTFFTFVKTLYYVNLYYWISFCIFLFTCTAILHYIACHVILAVCWILWSVDAFKPILEAFCPLPTSSLYAVSSTETKTETSHREDDAELAASDPYPSLEQDL